MKSIYFTSTMALLMTLSSAPLFAANSQSEIKKEIYLLLEDNIDKADLNKEKECNLNITKGGNLKIVSYDLQCVDYTSPYKLRWYSLPTSTTEILIGNFFGSAMGDMVNSSSLTMALKYFKNQGFKVKKKSIEEDKQGYNLQLTKNLNQAQRNFGANLHQSPQINYTKKFITEKLNSVYAHKFKKSNQCDINVSKTGKLGLTSLKIKCDNILRPLTDLSFLSLKDPNKKINDSSMTSRFVNFTSLQIRGNSLNLAVSVAVIKYFENLGFSVLDNRISEDKKTIKINAIK